jgi:hypothetical protein
MKKVVLFITLLLLLGCGQQTGSVDEVHYTDDTCPPSDNKYTLFYGESTYIGDYTVTIQDITIGSVDVDVDGSSTYVGTGGSAEIRGLKIRVYTTDAQEPVEGSSAVLSFSC